MHCVVVSLTQKSNGYLRDSPFPTMTCIVTCTVTRTYVLYRERLPIVQQNLNNWTRFWWKTLAKIKFSINYCMCYFICSQRCATNRQCRGLQLGSPSPWRGNYWGRQTEHPGSQISKDFHTIQTLDRSVQLISITVWTGLKFTSDSCEKLNWQRWFHTYFHTFV